MGETLRQFAHAGPVAYRPANRDKPGHKNCPVFSPATSSGKFAKEQLVDKYVAYILLLILVLGLPAVVLTAPLSIDWTYWLALEVPAWKAAWFALACVLAMGAFQMLRDRRLRLLKS